jgi:hypothetical protein
MSRLGAAFYRSSRGLSCTADALVDLSARPRLCGEGRPGARPLRQNFSGQAAATDAYPTARLIHLPVHASSLNQIELYISIVQRKALAPNDFPNLQALTDRLTTFAEHYRTIARPFDWTFTRNDPNQVLAKIADRERNLRLAAQRSRLADSSTS